MQRSPSVCSRVDHHLLQLLTTSAAGLNLTEPHSTGIGGDMFCLFYDAKTRKVSSLNGSGRAPGANTLESIRQDLGIKDGMAGKIPMSHVHSVTVPGAAAGWVDTVKMFGSGNLTLEQILAPAIEMGEKGFPVSELASTYVRDKIRVRSKLLANTKTVDSSRKELADSFTQFQGDAQGGL
jgi:gamma-glutamyltranspeptidase/glutathione hydrolase